jgi:hypothetical protein
MDDITKGMKLGEVKRFPKEKMMVKKGPPMTGMGLLDVQVSPPKAKAIQSRSVSNSFHDKHKEVEIERHALNTQEPDESI